MAIKVCKVCGGEFETQGNGKVCPECRHGPCAICGKDIQYSQYQLKQVMDGKQVSCSGKCRAALTKKNLMEREGIENVSQRESLAHRSYKRTCRLCGKEFEGGRTASYCPACKTVTCPVCGKEFVPSPPHFSRYLKQGWLTCGDSSCRVEMTRRNLLEREGVENVSQRGEVREKLRETRLNDSEETRRRRSESLRSSCSRPEVIEARANTNRERTGYEWPLLDPEVKARAAASHTPESIAKSQATFASHHNGARTPFQVPEVKQKIKEGKGRAREEKRRAIERYLSEHPDATPRKVCGALGMKYHSLLDYNRTFDLGLNLHHSSYEEAFRDALLERGVDYEREYRMQVDGLNDRRNCPRYDFLVGDVLVEVDPWYYHNATGGMVVYGHEVDPHGPRYHIEKSKYAMEHEGKRCIHIFDWDDYEMIADMFVDKVFVNADDLRLETLGVATDELNAFLDANHLQGRCRGVRFASVLRDGDGIASAMTFGAPRYNSKHDWELLRYCTRTGLAIRGGSRTLWDAFLAENGGSVVSYCDNAKFGGRVYEKLGFSLDDPGDSPHLHWYSPDTGQHFTAAYVNQMGVDRLLGTDYGKGARNDELMLKEGFVEIYDCGQSRWVYAK